MLIKLGNVGFRSTKIKNNFSPTETTNLGLWLDANDISTITHTSNSVSQWDDKSGNNINATQATGYLKPATNSTTINNKNVINFNGDYMSLLNMNVTGDWTFNILLSITSTPAIISYVFGDTGRGIFVEWVSESSKWGVYSSSSLFGSNLNQAQAYILTVKKTGTVYSIYTNGILESSGSISDIDFTSTTLLGTRPDLPSFSFLGSIGEVILNETALATSEINQLGNYLASKWGATWSNI